MVMETVVPLGSVNGASRTFLRPIFPNEPRVVLLEEIAGLDEALVR